MTADSVRTSPLVELGLPFGLRIVLRQEMTDALTAPNTAVPSLDWLTITDRTSGAITLTKCEAAPEPRNLRRVKARGARGPP